MPTYEYLCENCGHEFERFQSITAAVLRKCPRCNKRTLKRLVGTGAGVIFKGSGFYETDYRSESYKKAEQKEKNSAEPAKEKTTKSKDTKPGEKAKPDTKKKTA